MRPGRILAVLVAVAIVGVVFAYFLPRIADYGEVWGVVRHLPDGWIAALAAVAAANAASNALPWMAALPGLGFVHAARVGLGPAALSIVIPGGGAVSPATQFGMLRSWGLDRRSAVLAAGVVNVTGQLAAYGLPVIAIAALSADGGYDRNLLAAGGVGVAVFAVIAGSLAITFSSERRAKRTGDLAARALGWTRRLLRAAPADWTGDHLVHFRHEALDLLRRRSHLVTTATLASQLAVFAVLVVTLRAVGITSSQVDVVEAFAAWCLIRVLGKIPITPAGFGVEEIALAGALIGFGAHNTVAVTATLVYRFLTIAPPLLLGLAAAATYRAARPSLDR